MRWGINLRGDLAKLSDAELADKFEFLTSDRQAAYDAIHWIVGDIKWLYQRGLMFWWGRGPLHSPAFYKIAGGGLGPFKWRFGELHMLDCEIKDVRDEMESRVKLRRRAAKAR